MMLPLAYAVNWQAVATINGSADKTSETFTVTATEWRLHWEYTPDPEYPQYSTFNVFVYPQGETALYIDSFSADKSAQTSGDEYIYEGSGIFYLKIITANIPSYTVIIQQNKDAAATPAPTKTSNTSGTSSNSTGYTGYIIAAALVIIVVIAAVVIANLQARKHRQPTQAYPPPPPPPQQP